MTDEKLKIAVIAGASTALSYKEKKPSASESEILSYITKNVREILGRIDGED